MKDIFGEALIDFLEGHYTEDIITWTNITEDDELPLPYLFRSYQEMPPIEQTALQEAKGKVLDVGCAAGSHALYLQKKDHEVLGIDISPGAVKVCKKRGLKNVRKTALLDLSGETFDTILLLMNGTGIFGKIDQVPKYLKHLKSLLNPGGQILIDSTDLIYMYEDSEDGSYLIPTDRYYGEVTFWMSYKNRQTEPFDWLYLNDGVFEEYCKEAGLQFEVVERGDNFDYLARIF